MKRALFTTALLISGATFASPEINSWYISAFGGYASLSSNIKTHYFGYYLSDVNYHFAFDLGGSIGYQRTPLRYEFQYTYFYAGPDRYSVDYEVHPDIDGGTRANMLMGNLYYDFPEMLEAITPFIGVGAGYAFMHATLNSTSRFDKPHFKARQDSFAYQGIAGLTYNFTENFVINATYRYTATASSSAWGKNLQAQMGSIGLVYYFDSCDSSSCI